MILKSFIFRAKVALAIGISRKNMVCADVWFCNACGMVKCIDLTVLTGLSGLLANRSSASDFSKKYKKGRIKKLAK